MSPRFEIRMASPADAADILNIYGYYIEQTVVSLETVVPSIPVFANRIQTTLRHSPWIVCCSEAKVVGYAYAGLHRFRSAYRFTKELSVYIDKSYQRMSIATVLYRAIIEILKMQGVTNTLIGISLPNDASVAFHENFGYQPVGVYHNIGIKFDRFVHVGWWEMKIQDQQQKDILHYNEFADEVDKVLGRFSTLLNSGK